MSTWYCDTYHETEQFNDLESFMQHMKDPANHPGQPLPSDLQLDTLSRSKQRVLTREDEYSCPLCDCIPEALKPVIPTSEPKAIRHQLHKHIARHIKNLAVLSVPVLTTAETNESESDEPEDEGKGRRLKEGEKASDPSGYDEELRATSLSDDDGQKEIPSLDVLETQNAHWRDIGFIEWYESEEAGVNKSGLETDSILQDFLRAQGEGGTDLASNGSDRRREKILARSHVFRVTGLSRDLPDGDIKTALQEALNDNFADDERSYIKTEITIVPSCYESDTQRVALVQFRGEVPQFLFELRLEEWQIEMGDDDIIFDGHFFGFTQLYAPDENQPVVAE